MRQWICVLLMIAGIAAGCKKDRGSGQGPEEVTSSKSRDSVYSAELVVVTRSPAGQGSTTLLLTSNDGVTSTFDFEVSDDRRCLLSDTFLEHKDGTDIWRIDLHYSKRDGAASLQSPPISKTLFFDGVNSLSIIEDDHHSIIIQPRHHQSEHGPDSIAATESFTLSIVDPSNNAIGHGHLLLPRNMAKTSQFTGSYRMVVTALPERPSSQHDYAILCLSRNKGAFSGSVRDDVIRINLHPQVDDGNVYLEGTLSGDLFKGTCLYQSYYGYEPFGTFEAVRQP